MRDVYFCMVSDHHLGQACIVKHPEGGGEKNNICSVWPETLEGIYFDR